MHRTSKAMIHEHASIHRRRIQAGLLRIPFSHVAVEEDGRLDLQLSGELPDDWCLRLANGLSMARIGLRNGYARRVEDQVWICQLEVQHENGAGRTPDFLDLAMRGTLRQRREEPPILDYELTDSTSRGGSTGCVLPASPWTSCCSSPRTTQQPTAWRSAAST
jgi:hypothetical protein